MVGRSNRFRSWIRLPRSAAIVTTVVALASALGLDSVAEGIETEAELETLRRMKCAAGQGYLWWKPLDADVALQLLLKQRSSRCRERAHAIPSHVGSVAS